MIKLIYMSNIERKYIGTINTSTESTYKSILSEILIKFKDAGISVDEETNHLHVVIDDKLESFSESTFSTDNDYDIIYSDVIAPQNACTFYEDEGIKYFFHTNEGNHLHFPHVHAENSGDIISISLNDFETIGKFGNRKKQNASIKFVSENNEKFKKAWDKLINEGICPKWED